MKRNCQSFTQSFKPNVTKLYFECNFRQISHRLNLSKKKVDSSPSSSRFEPGKHFWTLTATENNTNHLKERGSKNHHISEETWVSFPELLHNEKTFRATGLFPLLTKKHSGLILRTKLNLNCFMWWWNMRNLEVKLRLLWTPCLRPPAGGRAPFLPDWRTGEKRRWFHVRPSHLCFIGLRRQRWSTIIKNDLNASTSEAPPRPKKIKNYKSPPNVWAVMSGQI